MYSDGKQLPTDIQKALTDLAKRKNIHDPTISCHFDGKSQGALGIVYFVVITDTETDKCLNLVVKMAPGMDKHILSDIIGKTYSNELYFYTTLWPMFQNIQRSITGENNFNMVPSYHHTAVSKINVLILDDLRAQGYQTIDRRIFFNRSHLKIAMREYGKFHALSFILRSQSPEKFHELTENFTNIFLSMENVAIFKKSMELVFKQCFELFKEDPNTELRRMLEIYSKNCFDIYCQSQNYNGENKVLVHGDCWSNNILFKYNKLGQPIDMKLIDFQQMYATSPVFDLSYCIYSSGTSDIFEHLDEYLQMYHKSLTSVLHTFNLDISQIYSFETLKSEWQNHSKFGFCMGLLQLKNKLLYDKEENEEITEKLDEDLETFEMGKYDIERFQTGVRDLVHHMYKHNYL